MKLSIFSQSFIGIFWCLSGFSYEENEISSESSPVTDVFYNSEGKQVGKVTVTAPDEVGNRGSFNYSGDKGSMKGSVSTSHSTESPVETFYDSRGKSVGTSSMSSETGTSTKTFYDAEGNEMGNVSPNRGNSKSP